MKTRVKINEISKEELYELYLKQVEKCEELESKIFKQQLELAEKTKKLEEALFQLTQRNKTIFGKKRETNTNDKNVFNEAENTSSKKETRERKTYKEKNVLTRDFLESHYSDEIVLSPDEIKTNKELVKFGEDVTFKIESIPARLKIIKIINEKYIDQKVGKVYQKIKDDIYPHFFVLHLLLLKLSIISSSLASHIIVKKSIYITNRYIFLDKIYAIIR